MDELAIKRNIMSTMDGMSKTDIPAGAKLKFAYNEGIAIAKRNGIPISNGCAYSIMSMKRDILANHNYDVLNAADDDTDGCVWSFLNFIYTHPQLDVHTVIEKNLSIFRNNEDMFWEVFKIMLLTNTIDVSSGTFKITDVGKISFIIHLKNMKR